MLKVTGLCKNYPKFRLNNVSFNLPEGYIMGFVGRNGAGKSTTLKAIMRAVIPDGGQVEIFGKDMALYENEIKNKVSFTLGAFDYYPRERTGKIASVYKNFFPDWKEDLFRRYVKEFDLDTNKRVRELSAGMKVKFALALALSHEAKLFIFDEPTSGLDPIARDELLDIFQGIVQDGDKSIIFSTHITSDLDKCADYVLFIRDGEIIANDTKDRLTDGHALVKGSVDMLTEGLKNRLVSYKTNRYGFTGLIKRENILPDDLFATEKPLLEDIMVYYSKESQND